MDATTKRDIIDGLADRIQDARKEAKIVQKQLEKATGIKQQTISDFENGNKTPSIKQLFDIAEALQKDPVKLLFDVGKGNYDIAKETGLSDESINILKQGQRDDGWRKHFENRSAAVINALLSNKLLMDSLYGYLFSDFSELEFFDPFHPNAFHKIVTEDNDEEISQFVPEMQKVKASQVRTLYLESFESLFRLNLLDELASLRKSETITQKRKEQIMNKKMADGILQGMYRSKEVDMSDDEREDLIGLYLDDEKGEE